MYCRKLRALVDMLFINVENHRRNTIHDGVRVNERERENNTAFYSSSGLKVQGGKYNKIGVRLLR